jgi:hypothetical protein
VAHKTIQYFPSVQFAAEVRDIFIISNVAREKNRKLQEKSVKNFQKLESSEKVKKIDKQKAQKSF